MKFSLYAAGARIDRAARSLLPLGRIGREQWTAYSKNANRHHRQCHVLIDRLTFGNGRSLPLARGRSYLIHLFRNSRV